MKKIILCIILVSVLFILASCGGNDALDFSVKTERHAMIIMPDGSLIQGICTEFTRYSDNYMYVKVDGVEYYLDTWRVVTWKE